MGVLTRIFGGTKSKQTGAGDHNKSQHLEKESEYSDEALKFFVSYQRSAVYTDGSKDARLILDEIVESKSLEDVVARLENNEKALLMREDDVLNSDKEVALSDFGFVIKSNGKVVHIKDKAHEIAVAFNFLDDVDKWNKIFKAIDKPVVEIDDQNFETRRATIFENYPLITSVIAEGIGENVAGASYLDPAKSDYYSVFKFTLTTPFYALNDYFCDLSKKLGSFILVTLNSEAELIQLYGDGQVDEGLIQGHDWQYLMEDYGDEVIELLDDS